MKYQISPEVLFSKIDDEVIIMSIEADSYFGLDPVGSRVWELLEQPATMDELVRQLVQDFQDAHPRNKYWTDFEAFVDESNIEDFFRQDGDTIFVSTIH